MVLGEVREDRDVPVDRVGAVQRERVRGDLHDAGAVAGRRASARSGLQVDRLRGRADGRRRDARRRPARRSRAARLRVPAASSSDARQEGRRRLAVGAGDPDHLQRRGGVAVEARRRPGAIAAAHVGDHHLGDPEVRAAARTTSAAAPRSTAAGAKSWPSAREARDAEEERARLHRPCVVGELASPATGRSDAAAWAPSPKRSRSSIDRGRVPAVRLRQSAGSAGTAGRTPAILPKAGAATAPP